jgi:dephospho-CoA kinase
MSQVSRPKSPFILGLAGGIGAGKSTIAKMLAEHGAIVSDSDAHARLVLQQPAVKATLRQWWGDAILTPSGEIDRHALADIVFRSPADRKRLEALTHPLIAELREADLSRARAIGAKLFVIDAPLLFEAGLDQQCHAVLFIDTPPAERRARLSATRGWTDAEITRRESAQWPPEKKREHSTYTLTNTGNQAAIAATLDAIVAELVA